MTFLSRRGAVSSGASSAGAAVSGDAVSTLPSLIQAAQATSFTPVTADITATLPSLYQYATGTAVTATVTHVGTESVGGTSSLTVDFPASVAAGDLCVAIAYIARNRSVTTPTGWTSQGDDPIGSGSTTTRFYVFTKVYEASDGASLTFTTNSSAYSFSMSAFRSASSVGDIEFTAADNGTAADLTVVADGAMVARAIGLGSAPQTADTPSGYTRLADHTGGDHSFALFSNGYDAGSTGTTTIINDSDFERTASFVIEPA